MSEALEQVETPPKRHDLREAIRRVRIVNTEQADGLADLRDAERARLELLADSLADLIADVPDDLDFFAFALSNGETPRLWIDLTCHVAMGRDRRTYRLLKDTRLGRTVLHESADRDEMAERIADYVAERVLDRQRAIEGDWIELKARAPRADTLPEVDDNVAAGSASVTPPAVELLPQTPANEDIPGGRTRKPRRRVEAAADGKAPRPGGTKWMAFILGMLIGAGALAGTLIAQGRL
jgi:hypothetical protein